MRLGDRRKRVVLVKSILTDQELPCDACALQNQSILVGQCVDANQARDLAQLTVPLEQLHRLRT